MPSTGKLYHHKMKLKQLKPETKTGEVIEYLKKRHPLYFIANKISIEQTSDLINRLKFKLKQQTASTPVTTMADEKKASPFQQNQSAMRDSSKKENSFPASPV